MDQSNDLQFVNRSAELAFLEKCLSRTHSLPALVVVRSPPGFGKSRLTDQLRRRLPSISGRICIVDPAIRGRTGSVQIHDGYFIQRCAEGLNKEARAKAAAWSSFAFFMKRRRWKTAGEKRHIETATSDLPSLAHAYRLAFDYLARIFSFGKYAANQLLSSDQAEAVRICSEYVEDIIAEHPLILIVREAQHIDLESLRILLDLNRMCGTLDMIFEYTSEDGEFEPEHQKLLVQSVDSRVEMSILDLFPLDPAHLESLIRQFVKSDYSMTSEFYLAWNGNLRSIIELKFRTGVGRRISGPDEVAGLLSNLSRALDAHLRELTTLQQLLLVASYVHGEPIGRRILMSVANATHPSVADILVDAELKDLVDVHGFLSEREQNYSIRDETIATAVAEATFLKAAVAVVECQLRDFYRGILDDRRHADVSLASAVRLFFRLCARTKDVSGLVRASEALTSEVRQSQDQTAYVEIVAAAIKDQPDLFRADYDDLVVWAASLAYGISNWEQCCELLELRSIQDDFSIAMRSCALQEVGRHDEALQLASALRAQAKAPSGLFIAALIEGLIEGCRGNEDKARGIFSSLATDPAFSTSPLVGYAYRFFEVVDGFVECTDQLTRSVAWFDRFGFNRSKAYSQLPAAMFLARRGNIVEAKEMIAQSQQILMNEVRDQHLILNDMSAVDLLSSSPDYRECISRLTKALRSARDDYSELTIIINLALANWGARDIESALNCVERALTILQDHDFADMDVYWPVCFNAAQILAGAGMKERSEAMLRFPREHGRPLSANKPYWLYRYGETDILPEPYRFLASRPGHPLYLSHWTIDLEGLSLLRPTTSQ